jgi:Zn-dependent peptidase ImmA (M78 family)
MNIPSKVRIGSVIYDVVFTENNLVANGKECYATIDYNFHTIEINTKLADSQKHEQSLLHEIFHGILHDRGIELDDEESIVEALALGMHQIIKDNPEMVQP